MNKDYRFEVYTDYSSGEMEYVVRFYDFPNIIGSGCSVQDAFIEAQENLDFYLEYCKDKGKVIPEPSKPSFQDYSGKITFRMSKSLHKKIDERAKNEGISMNSLISEAVSSYIAGRDAVESVVKEASLEINKTAQKRLDEAYEYNINKIADDYDGLNDNMVV